MTHVAAIIPARGGSKGIPGKNLVNFCGKPLVAWTVQHSLQARHVTSTWVSSDSEQILEVARDCGALTIRRPDEISGDTATSESAWRHAIDQIEEQGKPIDLVVGLQATSPVREPSDIDRAIEDFFEQDCDSLMSVALVTELLYWTKDPVHGLRSVNYDYKKRGMRQDRKPQYLENGSIYVFSPSILRTYGNRLGGTIGASIMPLWKSFQIDEPEDVALCASIVRTFLPGTLCNV